MTSTNKILIALGGLFLFSRIVKGANNTGATNSTNLNAFLKTIQYAEGTFNQPNPYAVTYAYSHTIKNFNDHPSITGEWTGKTLPESFCKAIGITPPCKSTAAGAYQFLKPTWQSIKNRLGNIKFDRYGQDLAAIDLIERKGALNDILNGNFQGAIYKLNTIWASLPGSPYGQPTRSMNQLQKFYLEQGGNIFSV